MTAEAILKKIEIDTSTIKDEMNYFKKKFNAQLEVQRMDIESLKESYIKEIKSLKEESAKEIKSLKEDSKKKETQLETQRMEIDTFKKNSAKEIKSLKAQLELQKKEIESLNEVLNSVEEIKSLKEDSAKEINSLKSEIDGISVSVDMIKERTIMSGETTFAIDRIDNRMKIAEEQMLSPYFYSHNNGYKLRLEVFPGGHNGGCGSHVSLYVQICKGEFDTELPWPCRYSFHVSVVNQRSGGTHNTVTLSHDTASDNYEYCYNHYCGYNRPISKDNIGCGYDKFILHSDLRKVDGLRVNDRIIIKCVVTAPK